LQFLEAFGNKATTIKRLKSGSTNSSDIEDGVLQCDSSLMDGSYRLRLVRQNQDGGHIFLLLYDGSGVYGDSEVHKEIGVPYFKIKKWFGELEKNTVPIITDGISGCDGATYQLNFYTRLNISRFQ